MVRIVTKDIIKLNKDSAHVHTPVNATYSVFSSGGNDYFQIDTYGSAGRKLPGKCSQTIQLDRENLIELIRTAVAEMKITKDEIF